MMCKSKLFLYVSLFLALGIQAQEKPVFSSLDVFKLEYAVDPQISPNGDYVVYRRMQMDIMKDRSVGKLWFYNLKTNKHTKLTSNEASENSARWSPSGGRIVFTSSTKEGSEVFMYWLSTGKVGKISQLNGSPSGITWSRDGKSLAFSMFVPTAPPVIVKMPKKPKGADWVSAPRITDRLKHEADGKGYMKPGFRHIFVMSSDGGSARQITSGNYNHSGSLSWAADNKKIYFSANRNKDWEYDFRNSEVCAVNLVSKQIKVLTSRQGPDYSPKVSPNGKQIAFIGFKDKVQTYQIRQLHIMNIDGTNKKLLSKKLDRSVGNIKWNAQSTGLYFTYDDLGATKIAFIDLKGKITDLTDKVGGTTLGRPYPSGSYSVSHNGQIVFTHTTTQRPADVALLDKTTKQTQLLTQLNEDVLPFINLGKVSEINYTSRVDKLPIQGWVVYPPNYDASKPYKLIVENHGGPILNYGPRFSVEMQLLAASGYVVFYPNPRGSTSYGEYFGNLLYNNYPGDDYHDVMDGVDYLIKKGIADADKLYVTGGSAGGIMTAWIIGKTNRFKAAAVIKPVMNWISKTLVADNYFGYANARYPGQPWENFKTYWKFSPISLVGNVETPTMVMVGMNDLRTPPSEAKQLYHALKIRKIETVLVEIPRASHGIASRPSQLITKIAHILAWFEKYP